VKNEEAHELRSGDCAGEGVLAMVGQGQREVSHEG
jgi:hypothetical protein